MYLAWNGTGLWLYGKLTGEPNSWTATIDGTAVPFPFHDQAKASQGLLLALFDLKDGPHTLDISKLSGGTNSSLGCSGVIIETVFDGSSETTLNQTTLDVSHFQWSLSGTNGSDWSCEADQCMTTAVSAWVQLDFVGESVVLYGNVRNAASTSYTVTLDGIMTQFNALPSSKENTVNVNDNILFLASGLPPGKHTLSLENNPLWTNATLPTEAIRISHATNSSYTPSVGIKAGVNSKHRDITIIASTIATSIVAFGLFLWVFPLYRKWRRERGMHVIFNYSLAPRPYPVDFFGQAAGDRCSDSTSDAGTSMGARNPVISHGSTPESSGASSTLSPVQRVLLQKEERRNALNSGGGRVRSYLLEMRKPPLPTNTYIHHSARRAETPTAFVEYAVGTSTPRTLEMPSNSAQPPRSERFPEANIDIGGFIIGNIPGLGLGAGAGQMFAFPAEAPPRYFDLR